MRDQNHLRTFSSYLASPVHRQQQELREVHGVGMLNQNVLGIQYRDEVFQDLAFAFDLEVAFGKCLLDAVTMNLHIQRENLRPNCDNDMFTPDVYVERLRM
jgi:hypothetical protein